MADLKNTSSNDNSFELAQEPKVQVTGTLHNLPFYELSPTHFEQLSLWLVKTKGYEDAEHYGRSGSDGGRDVIGYKTNLETNVRELWYFQCKRTKKIDGETLKREVDKILNLASEKPALKPVGIRFIITCAVSAQIRDEVTNYCTQHSLGSSFLADTELDQEVHNVPSILGRFFQLPGIPASSGPLSQVEDRSEEVETLNEQIETTLKLYLGDCFRREQNALQEAGEGDLSKLALEEVFIDLDVETVRVELSTEESRQVYEKLTPKVQLIERQKLFKKTTYSFIYAVFTQQLAEKVLVIGGPGQGKSTLLQQVAQIYRAKLLNKALKTPVSLSFEEVRIPFRVILKNYANWLVEHPEIEDNIFAAYLSSILSSSSGGYTITIPDIYKMIRLKACLLLLDGLDEVADQQFQDKMLDSIAHFLDHAEIFRANLRVVISSRPLPVTLKVANSQLDLDQFESVELVKLSSEKARQYAMNWINGQTADEVERQTILAAFENCQKDPKFNLLLGTPLQVTILLRVIKERGTPPSLRAALFQTYWQIVLNREVTKSTANNPLIKSTPTFLFELHSFLGYVIHSRSAHQQVDARLTEVEFRSLLKDFLKEFDESLSNEVISFQIDQLIKETGDRIFLINRPQQGYFSFEPRSFQEFFAAAYLLQRGKGKGTSGQYNILKMIAPYQHWFNVFLFSVGLIATEYSPHDVEEVLIPLFEHLDGRRGEGINLVTKQPNLALAVSSASTQFDQPILDRLLAQHLRPGAWLALEIIEDGALEERPNCQKKVLEYGLEVLDSALSDKQVREFQRFLYQASVIQKVKQQIIVTLTNKLNRLPTANVYNILHIGSVVQGWDWKHNLGSQALQQKLEMLLALDFWQEEYSGLVLINLAISSQLPIGWVVRQLLLFWPRWIPYLPGWIDGETRASDDLNWLYEEVNILDEDMESNTNDRVEDFVTNLNLMRHEEDLAQYYIYQLLKSWSPTVKEVKEIQERLLIPDALSYADSFRNYLSQYLSKATSPLEELLTFLSVRILIANNLEADTDHSLDLMLGLGNFGHIEIKESFLQPDLLAPATFTEVQNILYNHKSSHSSALRALLWVLYLNIVEPVERDVQAFIEDLAIFSVNTTVLERFIQQLDENVRAWPLFAIAAKYQLFTKSVPSPLLPFLEAPAQTEFKLSLIKTLKSDVEILSPIKLYKASRAFKIQNQNELESLLPQTSLVAKRFGSLSLLIMLEPHFEAVNLLNVSEPANLEEELSRELAAAIELVLKDLSDKTKRDQLLQLLTYSKFPLTSSGTTILQTLFEVLLEEWERVQNSNDEITVNNFRENRNLLPGVFSGLVLGNTLPSNTDLQRWFSLLENLEDWKSLGQLEQGPLKRMGVAHLRYLSDFVFATQGTQRPGLVRFCILSLVKNANFFERWVSNRYVGGKLDIILASDHPLTQLGFEMIESEDQLEFEAAIMLLSHCDCPIEQQFYQNLLWNGLNIISQESKVEWKRVGWIKHFSLVALSDPRRVEWAKFFSNILDNPQSFTYEVLKIALEKLGQLAPTLSVTFSTEEAREHQLAE